MSLYKNVSGSLLLYLLGNGIKKDRYCSLYDDYFTSLSIF